MRRSHADQPLLITTARESGDIEFDRRRRKYLIMMIMRAVCVIAATLTYHHSLLLALAFIVAGAVLPWCAVLIANDRPAKKRAARLGPGVGRGEEPALPGESDRTIDG